MYRNFMKPCSFGTINSIESIISIYSSVSRFGKLSLCESAIWHTSCHELCNKVWFEQIQTRV